MIAVSLKLLPVALAIAWVLRARPLPSARYRRLLLAGLSCGLLGDALLISPGRFIAGLVAFLCGHLCYALAFSGEGARPRPASLAGPLAFAALVIAALFADLGALRIPVLLYVLAIAAMAALAIDRWRRERTKGAPAPAARAALGALFFLVSDALLAWGKFHAPLSPRALHAVLVLGTYYAAQLLLASSVSPDPPR